MKRQAQERRGGGIGKRPDIQTPGENPRHIESRHIVGLNARQNRRAIQEYGTTSIKRRLYNDTERFDENTQKTTYTDRGTLHDLDGKRYGLVELAKKTFGIYELNQNNTPVNHIGTIKQQGKTYKILEGEIPDIINSYITELTEMPPQEMITPKATLESFLK